MNKQEKRKKLREILIKEMDKGTLNEGILEKLLMAFLSPMIKREIKKIKNDPEIKAAEEGVKTAIDQWKLSLDNAIKTEKQRLKDSEQALEDSKLPLKYKSKHF